MNTVRAAFLALTLALAVMLVLDPRTEAQQPIGPAPPQHTTCGEAPMLILNEDTGEIFPAVGATLTPKTPTSPAILRFRDGRLFCNGYEGSP